MRFPELLLKSGQRYLEQKYIDVNFQFNTCGRGENPFLKGHIIMKTKSSLPSILSLVFGAALLPLSIIRIYVFLFSCLCRVDEIRTFSYILWIIILCITAALAVSSIILGIIGIKKKSSKKVMAVEGIIISSLIILCHLCFYLIVLNDSNAFPALLQERDEVRLYFKRDTPRKISGGK